MSATSGSSAGGMRWAGALRIFAAIAAIALALAVWRREVLDWPPYWDFIIGLWVEANFLADTGFDYARLMTTERPIFEGGARCYTISAMPTVVAGLMRLLSTPRDAIVAYHLLTISCAAVVVWCVYDIVRQRGGWLVAAATAGCTLTMPLFSAQVEMLGMDMPFTACTVVTVWAVDRRRWTLALVAAVAAFAVKATGLVVVVALVGFWIARRILRHFDPDRSTNEAGWAHIAIGAVLAGAMAWIIAWGSGLDHQMDQSHRVNDPGLAAMRWWCPDLLTLLIGVTVLSAGVVAVALRRRATPTDIRRRWLTAVARLSDREATVFFAAIVIVGVLASITRIIFLPRYLLPVVPLAHIVLAVLLLAVLRWRIAVAGIFGAMLAVHLANQYGQLFPDLVEIHGPRLARTGALLERSLEYRADQRSNMAAARTLAELDPQDPIVAGWPFPHMLALPRLGFVERPLHGYSLNGFSLTFPAFRDIEQAAFVDRPRELICIDVGNTFTHFSPYWRLPVYREGDAVIYRDQQASPLLVYRHTVEPGPSPRGLAAWYLARIWPNSDPARRAVLLAEYLAAEGQAARALAELRTARQRVPHDRALTLATLRLLTEQAQWLEAGELLVAELLEPASVATSPPRKLFSRTLAIPGFAETRPGDWWRKTLDPTDRNGSLAPDQRTIQAIAQIVAGRLPEALATLQAAAEADPPAAGAAIVLGLIARGQGRYDDAQHWLERARAADPSDAQAAAALGGLALDRGQLIEADRELRAAIELDKDCFPAWRDLALVLARQEQWTEAYARAVRAARLRSDDRATEALVERLAAKLVLRQP